MKVYISVLIASLFLIVTTVPAGESVDFSGTWVMNPEKSESRAPGGGSGGRGGGRARQGGGRGGDGRTLVVKQEGPSLNVEQGRRSYVIEPGAGPKEIETRRGPATIEASWKGRTLIVNQVSERDTPRGLMKIEQKQVWELTDDGKTLVQSITLNTPRGVFERKLVFDRQ